MDRAKVGIELCNIFNMCSVNTGKFRLGPRAILELESLLQDANFAEDGTQIDAGKFETCSLCADLIIRGNEYFCAAPNCSQTFHQFCLFNYQESVQKQECPGCKSGSSLISKSDHVNDHMDNRSFRVETGDIDE